MMDILNDLIAVPEYTTNSCQGCHMKSTKELDDECSRRRLASACLTNNTIYINRPATVATGETDPTGRDPHAPGAKLDAGKPRMSLVLGTFGRALTEVAKVGTFGAKKYTDNGWLSVPNGQERYTDALYRHLLAEQRESNDPDSGLLHAAHAAWNALARLELLLRAKDSDAS